MPRSKTLSEKAAGKLISAIQKEWGEEVGESTSEISMDVMDSVHVLIQARTANEMKKTLDGKTLIQYLGDLWVKRHPAILEPLTNLEQAIEKESV